MRRTNRIWTICAASTGCRGADEAIEVAEYLREILTEKPISHILATGLHDYLDIVQIHLQNLAGAIGRALLPGLAPGRSAD
jgi:hypothetical protein